MEINFNWITLEEIIEMHERGGTVFRINDGSIVYAYTEVSEEEKGVEN